MQRWLNNRKLIIRDQFSPISPRSARSCRHGHFLLDATSRLVLHDLHLQSHCPRPSFPTRRPIARAPPSATITICTTFGELVGKSMGKFEEFFRFIAIKTIVMGLRTKRTLSRCLGIGGPAVTLSANAQRGELHTTNQGHSNLPWWMPAGEHPVGTDNQGVGIVSEMKRSNGGPACRREANNPDAVIRPAEVFRPTLEPRVEEDYISPRVRIPSRCPVGFEAVAQRATRPEVWFRAFPALSAGNNVLNLESRHHKSLRTQAVATPVARSLAHPPCNVRRDSLTRHDRCSRGLRSMICASRAPPRPARPEPSRPFRVDKGP